MPCARKWNKAAASRTSAPASKAAIRKSRSSSTRNGPRSWAWRCATSPIAWCRTCAATWPRVTACRRRKIDVLVRSVDTRAASIEEVRNLIVNPGSERPVTLSAVADVRLATGPAEIRRANQERVAVISATPADGDLGDATVRGAGDPRPNYPAGGHPRLGVRAERGDDRELPLAGSGVRAGRVPGVPGDGLAVRITAAPLRHPVHHSDGSHRFDLGPVHHRHDDQLGGAHRAHHAGRYRGQQRDRPHRRDQPGARSVAWNASRPSSWRDAPACAPS